MLMLRLSAVPETADFHRGADAFDKAVVAWDKHRFFDAANGFMTAGASFAAAGAEGNVKYAYQNAAYGFEAAGKVTEGKAAFTAAASKDPKHAVDLRALGSKIVSRANCK
jgi:hypothetical protein